MVAVGLPSGACRCMRNVSSRSTVSPQSLTSALTSARVKDACGKSTSRRLPFSRSARTAAERGRLSPFVR